MSLELVEWAASWPMVLPYFEVRTISSMMWCCCMASWKLLASDTPLFLSLANAAPTQAGGDGVELLPRRVFSTLPL